MAWTFTSDLGGYLDAVGELLSSEPVRHTVQLTVLGSLSRLGPDLYGAEPPLLGWWPAGRLARAAVLQTPPYPMLMTSLPAEAADELAVALADRRSPLSTVNGPLADASAFASAWFHATGRRGQESQRMRLYQLGVLVRPDPSPGGAARVATVGDVATAASWNAAFSAETGQASPPGRMLEDRLRGGQLLLWEVGGELVSMAGVTTPVGGVARVGPVYTPPDHRGRGYGAAVTAAISAVALERGALSVCLFTDLANPTSNSIYQKLGYQPVEDRIVLDFTTSR